MIYGANLRTTGLLAVAVGMAVVLAACGSTYEDAEPSVSGSASTAPATLKQIGFLLVNPTVRDMYSVNQTKENPYVKELERLSGYDLTYEFLSGGEETNKQLAIRFASGDLPDVVRTTDINAPIHPAAVEQGAFTDLTELIGTYAPTLKKAIPEEVWNSPMVSKNGRIYGIPSMWPNPDTRVIYYRKDWLAKAGMSELKTLDDWLQFFEYVKNHDMNGDGLNNEIGFAAREQLAYSDLFFGAFGVHPNMWVMQDGEYVPSMITDRMKEAVRFWKMLYDKGYINKNIFTNRSGDWDAMIRSGRAAAWLHDAANYPTWNNSFVHNPADTSVIGMAAAPVGPYGDSFLRGRKTGIYYVNVVPSKAKHPEQIVQYFEWAYTSKEAQNFFHYGIEGVNYRQEGGRIVFTGVPEPVPSLLNDEQKKNIFTLLLNPRGVGFEDPEVIALSPVGSTVQDGYTKAKKSAAPDDTPYMPAFEWLKLKPELQAATATGTLFMDMFAKALTGKESVDAAFSSFVGEWKKRGGDQLIKEATAWHQAYTAGKETAK